MARRFKRRKPRVVWLKPTGTLLDSTGVVQNANENLGALIFDGLITVGAGATPVLEIPLVLDNPTETADTGAPLTVLQTQGLNLTQNFGYRLRRIVGSILICGERPGDSSQDAAHADLLVTAGIIVRRVDEQTGTAIVQALDANPQLIAQWPDPWIWRRTWILNCAANFQNLPGGANFNAAGIFGWDRFPISTAHYGDIRSGPHVDAKTARRIGPEERLFLDVGFQGLPIRATDNAQTGFNVRMVADLRCLATINMNSGNRRNASR